VAVAVGIQDAMHMRYIAICCLPASTIFFHIISQTARFSGEKKKKRKNKEEEEVMEHKTCVLIFARTFAKNISHSKN